MADFIKRKSVFGRHLYVTSTGGIGGQMATSTGFNTIAQMWGDGMITSHTSSGDTLPNYGVSVISAASATAATYLISAPIKGISKEIYIASSGTSVIFGGTSTATLFMKLGSLGGSTIVTVIDAVSNAGVSLTLRGLSATQWGMTYASTVIVT